MNDSITIDEVKKFVKTPKKGDIIKVYIGWDYAFGIVTKISSGSVKEDGKITKREIAVLLGTNEEYLFDQCAFCFSFNKVRFEGNGMPLKVFKFKKK